MLHAPTTTTIETVLARGVTVSNTIRVMQNNNLLSIAGYSVTSSDTNIVPNFTVNNRSNYSFTIRAGSKAKDAVTLTLQRYGYSAIYKVEELLQSPAIVLR